MCVLLCSKNCFHETLVLSALYYSRKGVYCCAVQLFFVATTHLEPVQVTVLRAYADTMALVIYATECRAQHGHDIGRCWLLPQIQNVARWLAGQVLHIQMRLLLRRLDRLSTQCCHCYPHQHRRLCMFPCFSRTFLTESSTTLLAVDVVPLGTAVQLPTLMGPVVGLSAS